MYLHLAINKYIIIYLSEINNFFNGVTREKKTEYETNNISISLLINKPFRNY